MGKTIIANMLEGIGSALRGIPGFDTIGEKLQHAGRNARIDITWVDAAENARQEGLKAGRKAEIAHRQDVNKILDKAKKKGIDAETITGARETMQNMSAIVGQQAAVRKELTATQSVTTGTFTKNKGVKEYLELQKRLLLNRQL